MLYLRGYRGDNIIIGPDAEMIVRINKVDLTTGEVELAFDAPKGIPINREQVYKEKMRKLDEAFGM